MNASLIFKDVFSCQLKDVDRKNRLMVGAFTAYNNLDSDGDIGRKGMFTKTWQENFGRIKHLLNHDVTKPVGKIKRLYDDDTHAYYESVVGIHKLGDDVLDMAESGLLTEHSYGYTTVKQKKTSEGNELLQVKQWELSNLTGWGANENTPLLSFTKQAGGKDLELRMADRMKSLEMFTRNSNASDDTIELLLLEIKQLQTSILTLSTSSTSADDESPEPQKGEKDDDALLLVNTAIQSTLLKSKIL